MLPQLRKRFLKLLRTGNARRILFLVDGRRTAREICRLAGDPDELATLSVLCRLLQANLHNDEAAIAEVVKLLENIADAWRQIGPNYQPSQDAM